MLRDRLFFPTRDLSLRPNCYLSGVRELTAEHLGGCRFVILDLDNTVLEHGETVVNPEIIKVFLNLREQGAIERLCILSNIVSEWPKRRPERLRQAAVQLRANCFVGATGRRMKPCPEPFQKAMRLMSAPPELTVVIGDQVFTDIRGGNRLGLRTIYVKPLGRDKWFTRVRRILESRAFRFQAEAR